MSSQDLFAKIGVLTRRRDFLAQRVKDHAGSKSALEHDHEEAEALTAAIEALHEKVSVKGPLP